ncbi:MAG: hypothetical protein IPP15_16150 [Saprospiraceae bacterium]|uniref:Uncharacterized protein n=1 Tax=Candidatus Opimibacter skivensis TaxID=2982028 RepID=A0A9D7XQ69_9BACT|nr:hypothetical protein [Candidatus Opimibacter skivensis]
MGFTKFLKPVILYLESQFPLGIIKIVKLGTSGFSEDQKILTLTEEQLDVLHSVFKHNDKKQKEDNEILASEQLNLLFPENVTVGERLYIGNSISIILSS